MAVALTKSKRFNEIFHIMLEHRLHILLKDVAAYARAYQHGATAAPPAPVANGAASQTLPARVRRMLEDLGPTFIKIGQLLGTRPDLIPKEFIAEFKKMYDQTTPTPFGEIKAQVEGELGQPVAKVFKSFDENPIASASIAQVHRAVLRSGETVAVKVQHPDIEARMRMDFEILRGIVQFTEKVFAATQIWQPVKHLEEIRMMLNRELDFNNEMQAQIRLEESFTDVPEIKIPHVYADRSTKRVLAMEFIHGTKFYARGRLKLSRADEKNLARIITHAMAKQIFIDRLFHADPSPGNLLIIDRNQVCFLDFGAVGQVTKRRARHIFDFITAMSAGNLEDVARVIVDMCEVRREYDARQFLFDLERIVEYYERERPSPADPVLLEKITALANRHGMLLPSDFMLITRALYQFDGMCKELDPGYELLHVLQPFVTKTIRDQFFSPTAQKEALSAAAEDFAKFVTRLPNQLERILVKLERGQLTTRTEISGLEEYKRHRAVQSYFVGFSLLLGLLILSVALGFGLGGPQGLRVAAFFGVFTLLMWALAALIVNQVQRRRF